MIAEQQTLSLRVADFVKKKKKVSFCGLDADFPGEKIQQCLGGSMAFCLNCSQVHQKTVLEPTTGWKLLFDK